MSLQRLMELEAVLGHQEGALQNGKKLLLLSQRDGDKEYEGVAWRQLGLIAVDSGRKREGVKLMALGILSHSATNRSEVEANGELIAEYLTELQYSSSDIESLFTEAKAAYESNNGWGLLQEIFDDR